MNLDVSTKVLSVRNKMTMWWTWYSRA